MDDLISRSALLQEIDETAEAVEQQNVCVDIKKAFLDALATVKEHVANMPTAYNVDKVVEQVSEITDRIHNYCEEIDNNIPEQERSGYKMLPDIEKLQDVIKAGGVNEANA